MPSSIVTTTSPSASILRAIEKAATPTGQTENRAPDWAKSGALVYRVCTTDKPDVLPSIEQGLEITNHLLDGSIRQIPILHGIIGHDHPGGWNWDGLWPYWERVTYRVRDWATLHDFMQRVKERSNTTPTFHVNLTDVDAGLADYPETRDFYKKLVATKSIYRRDGFRMWPDTYPLYPPFHERDLDPPYVPRELPPGVDPIQIVALVNYGKFWDSGLAKEMIDGFYSRLPYAPPILYLDVLTLSGANFSTGFPDGQLGGSEKTQLDGVLAIAEYLHSKGTDVATEGDRPLVSPRGTYGWLHCRPGYSADDYSIIRGASHCIPLQHVAGNTGCFVASPIASIPHGLDRVRSHYAALLAGQPGPKPVPGFETCHTAHPVGWTGSQNIPGILSKWRDPFNNVDIHAENEFDMPGASDAFRGDLADLINNFYLTGIQELYHIGKRNVRTAVFNQSEILYVTRFGIVDSAGLEITIPAIDFAPPLRLEAVRKSGRLLIERHPVEATVKAPHAGTYQLKLYGNIRGTDHAALNIYANGKLQQTVPDISFPTEDNWEQEFPLGEITLDAGDNLIVLDAGPIYMRWSDGTTALWTTPYLCKGFTVTSGDVTFADEYDRMWPDTWSGQKKIYFFSWDGTGRQWKLPQNWASVKKATLYPLTPDGRGKGIPVSVDERSAAPSLLPQVPHVLVPEES